MAEPFDWDGMRPIFKQHRIKEVLELTDGELEGLRKRYPDIPIITMKNGWLMTTKRWLAEFFHGLKEGKEG